jgi:CotH kinase protein
MSEGLGAAIAVLLVACVLFAAIASPALADEAEPLFDPGAVAEIDFTLPEASQQKLEEEPETDEYQHAGIAVTAGGQSYELPDVGFRLKGGHGSFRELSGKAAFKVKFNSFVKGTKLLGLKKLTLNNMVQDPSMVHEAMVYELFRSLGVPVPRTGYAFVTINGEPYGVYLNLETYDDVMLPRWFASTQHLYEADAPGVDVRTGEADTFEVDEGDDEDLTDLEALIAAANDESGDWSEGVEPVADLDEMTRMWAAERYAGHWDGYAGVYADPLPSGPFRPNNYYLHSLESGVFTMLPWGTDQTWEVDVEFDEPAGGLLFNHCLADESCEAGYENALGEVAATVPGLELDHFAACTAEMLAPWQEQEDSERAEYDAGEIATGVADARAFMAARPGQLAAFLGVEPPTRVPDGTEPCHPPEGEPGPVTAPTGPQPPLGSLAIKRVGLSGRKLKVRLAVPGAGKAELAVLSAGAKVCGGKGTTTAAGPLLIRCRLAGGFLEKLEERWRKVRVKASIATAAGPTLRAARTLKLPRR